MRKKVLSAVLAATMVAGMMGNVVSVSAEEKYDLTLYSVNTCLLYTSDMEYLRKYWSGKKASAPTLEKRHHKYFLRFTYTEEVTLTKTPVKEQVICSCLLYTSFLTDSIIYSESRHSSWKVISSRWELAYIRRSESSLDVYKRQQL